jgi:hypothetical protein
MPTMIIMMAANKMAPTAQPLASSPAPALDGYACSVIADPSSAVRPASQAGRSG